MSGQLAISKGQNGTQDMAPEFWWPSVCWWQSDYIGYLQHGGVLGEMDICSIWFFLFLSALVLIELSSMDLLKALFSIMAFQIMLFLAKECIYYKKKKINGLMPVILIAATTYPTRSKWPCKTMEHEIICWRFSDSWRTKSCKFCHFPTKFSACFGPTVFMASNTDLGINRWKLECPFT